jgi:hypothetical protein
MINSTYRDHLDLLTLGKVINVSGMKIDVKVEREQNLPELFLNGELIPNVSVGTSNLVVITKGFLKLVCIVVGEDIKQNEISNLSNIKQENYLDGEPYINEEEKFQRVLRLQLFGFIGNDGIFHYGISELPLVGLECRLIKFEELKAVYSKTYDESNEENQIKIGILSSNEKIDIFLPINGTFSGHIGIFGNTGSGKSSTLALLFSRLFGRLRLERDGAHQFASRFVFFDFNGEYSGGKLDDRVLVEAELKTILKLSSDKESPKDKLRIALGDLLEADFLAALLNATEKTQQPFINRVIDSSHINDWIRNNCDQNFRTALEQLFQDLFKEPKTDNPLDLVLRVIREFKGCNIRIFKDDFESKLMTSLKFHSKSFTFYMED